MFMPFILIIVSLLVEVPNPDSISAIDAKTKSAASLACYLTASKSDYASISNVTSSSHLVFKGPVAAAFLEASCSASSTSF
jgi:hypothetical protein